jgi:putative membrane protein
MAGSAAGGKRLTDPIACHTIGQRNSILAGQPMHFISLALIALVALEHVGFLVLEMFLWDQPVGRRVFGTSQAVAAASKTLAANQGLYNGFLAAGLAWGMLADRIDVKVFFLGCVIAAGVFGAITVNRRILAVQALPAALALAAVWIAG